MSTNMGGPVCKKRKGGNDLNVDLNMGMSKILICFLKYRHIREGCKKITSQ